MCRTVVNGSRARNFGTFGCRRRRGSDRPEFETIDRRHVGLWRDFRPELQQPLVLLAGVRIFWWRMFYPRKSHLLKRSIPLVFRRVNITGQNLFLVPLGTGKVVNFINTFGEGGSQRRFPFYVGNNSANSVFKTPMTESVLNSKEVGSVLKMSHSEVKVLYTYPMAPGLKPFVTVS